MHPSADVMFVQKRTVTDTLLSRKNESTFTLMFKITAYTTMFFLNTQFKSVISELKFKKKKNYNKNCLT